MIIGFIVMKQHGLGTERIAGPLISWSLTTPRAAVVRERGYRSDQIRSDQVVMDFGQMPRRKLFAAKIRLLSTILTQVTGEVNVPSGHFVLKPLSACDRYLAIFSHPEQLRSLSAPQKKQAEVVATLTD